MENVITTISDDILNYVTTFICAAIAGMIAKLLKRDKNRDGLSLAMAHDIIYRYASFYIASGEITVEEMRNLTYLYERYAAMGGNGTAKEMYERCMELPIVEKRTKWNPYYLAKGDNVVV